MAQRGMVFRTSVSSSPTKRIATVPFRYSLGLAVSQALMQAFSNLAMQVKQWFLLASSIPHTSCICLYISCSIRPPIVSMITSLFYRCAVHTAPSSLRTVPQLPRESALQVVPGAAHHDVWGGGVPEALLGAGVVRDGHVGGGLGGLHAGRHARLARAPPHGHRLHRGGPSTRRGHLERSGLLHARPWHSMYFLLSRTS